MKRILIAAVLLCGLVTFAAARWGIPWVERYAATLLTDEVQAAIAEGCPDCRFLTDRIDISLRSLSLTIGGARVEQGAVTVLALDRLWVDLRFAPLLSGTVDIKEVVVERPVVHGGSGTPLERIIDKLNAENDPAQPQRESPVEVVLGSVKVLDGAATWSSGDLRLESEGINATLEFDPDGALHTAPTVAKTVITSSVESFDPVTISSAGAEIAFEGDTLAVSNLALQAGKSFLRGEGVVGLQESEPIRATASVRLAADTLGVQKWFEGTLAGEVRVTGTLSAPALDGTMHLEEGPFRFRHEEQDVVVIDTASSTFSLSFPGKAPEVTVSSLELRGPNIHAAITEPLTAGPAGLSGRASLRWDRIDWKEYSIESVKLDVAPLGDLAKPGARLSGEVLGMTRADVRLPGFALNSTFRDSMITVEVKDLSAPPRLSLEGQLRHTGATVTAEPLTLRMRGFDPLAYFGAVGPLRNAVLDGMFSLQGPLTAHDAAAEGTLTVELIPDGTLRDLPRLTLDGSLKDGAFTANLRDDERGLTTRVTGNLESEHADLTLSLQDFRPARYADIPDCLGLTGNVRYAFDFSNPLQGKGLVTLPALDAGCGVTALSLSRPANIRLSEGRAVVEQLTLVQDHGTVELSGSLSAEGYDLSADAALDPTLLMSFVPLDDIRGRVTARLTLTGPLDTPSPRGIVELDNLALLVNTADLEVWNIHGRLESDGNTVIIRDLRGRLNHGTFDINGTVVPHSLAQSALALRFEQVQFAPLDSASATLHGNLALSLTEGLIPYVQGEIIVDPAEYTQSIDIRKVVNVVTSTFRHRRRTVVVREAPETPSFDVTVRPKSVWIESRWAEADLEGRLHVSGTPRSAEIRGSINTVWAWFEIGDHRFEVTHGIVEFTEIGPRIELFAETTLSTAAQPAIQVLLEISGPLTDPRILFASDTDLTHQEIIQLLTSGGGLTTQALVDQIATQTGLSHFDLFGEDGLLEGDTFLHRIGRFDEFSIEPSFNVETGTVEPTVKALKRLTDRFSLSSETTVARASSQSKYRLNYDATRRTALSAVLDNTNTSRNTASLGADVVWTAVDPERRFLTLRVRGNRRMEEKNVLRAARITGNSRITPNDLAVLEARTVEQYRKEGFPEATARMRCKNDGTFCRELSIRIVEGRRHTVTEMRLQGENLLPLEEVLEEIRGAPASERTRIRAVRRLYAALRERHYYATRASARYEFLPETGGAELLVRLTGSRRLEFSITGNKVFSEKELLKAVTDSDRPISLNAGQRLTREIAERYRKEGYLEVAVDEQLAEDSATHTARFLLTVHEGPRVTVDSVSIEGNATLSTGRLRGLLREKDRDWDRQVFSPETVIEEQISANETLIAEAYKGAGFAGTEVTSQILPGESGHSRRIVYTVSEPPRVRFRRLDFEGTPEEFDAPPQPELPITEDELSDYADQVEDALRRRGWLNASVEIERHPASDHTRFIIRAGEPVRVSAVRFTGNEDVSDEVLTRALRLRPGDRWDQEKIAETRRRLARLGLFSRIELEPLDGSLDGPEEELLISVTERQLTGLRLGLGADSEYGVHTVLEATDKSLFGDGRDFTFTLDGYWDYERTELNKGLVALRYSDPSFLGSKYRWIEDWSYQKVDAPSTSFEVAQYSLASFLERSRGSRIRYAFGHTAALQDLSSVEADAVLSPLDTGTLFLSSLGGRFSYSRRDDPLYLQDGYELKTDSKLAMAALGSEADYFSIGMHLSAAEPLESLSKRFSLAGRTYLGSAWVFGDTEEMPISERYYLGGRTSVRGFKENSLGPRGEAGSVLGGDTALASSLEARYLIRESFSTHLFLDAGNVWLRERELNGLRWSTGLGALYLSPVGPIGVDLGLPLDRERGESSVRLHFFIGGTF